MTTTTANINFINSVSIDSCSSVSSVKLLIQALQRTCSNESPKIKTQFNLQLIVSIIYSFSLVLTPVAENYYVTCTLQELMVFGT